MSFPYLRLKHKVIRNAYKLKEKEERKFTYLTDDLTQDQQLKRRDLRCLNAYARSMNLDSKFRGDAIIVDGIRYTHEDINKLPHEISLENAKIVEVQDGYAFQSEHAFLSSLYHCEFSFNDQKYHSSEQALHHVRADDNNQLELASKILETKTSREAMDLGKKVKTSDEYKQTEPTLLMNIHRARFTQNPELRQKLVNLKGNLYEATYHPVYGAGYSLAQRHLINKANTRGGNKLGLALEIIRNKFIEDDNSTAN